MSTFEEKFKHLNFSDNEKNKSKKEFSDIENIDKFQFNEKNSSEQKEKKEDINLQKGAAQEIFQELIKNITKNTQQDKMFILFLIAMLKSKKASNELILALLYIFL